MLQILLVLLIPAQAAYTYFTGQPVILQTAPVDPYSLLQGYYVTLRYEISEIETLETLPGWEAFEARYPKRDSSVVLLDPVPILYVVMERPDAQTEAETPVPWTPVRVAVDRPTDLPDNQVALRGLYRRWDVTYGLKRYFIPEDQRDAINTRIRQARQTGDRGAYVVEVNVTDQSTSVPVSLWIDGEEFRF